MIIFETITSIDDSVFDRLFYDSISALDGGTYPWHLVPGELTDTDKRNHMRHAFEEILTKGFVWQVSVDNYPCLLNGGVQEGSTAKWTLGIVSPDQTGSKSFLYSEEYRDARDLYWEERGLTGWTLETLGPDNPINQHIVNRNKGNTLRGSLSQEQKDFGFVNLLNISVGKVD